VGNEAISAGYGGERWHKRFEMVEVILQKGQRVVEKSYRWSVSVGNGLLDGGGAFDTVRWGNNPSESPRKCEPLCI